MMEYLNIGALATLPPHLDPSLHTPTLHHPILQFPNSTSPTREKMNFKLPTTKTANRTRSTPSAATCGTQPLPQNCQTTVEITKFFRVPSAKAMVTSR